MVVYCSLGYHCHSTQILKRNKIKKESYPFDWIFSNIFIVTDCLNDDFKKMLDKNLYIENNGSSCGHSFYKKKLFPHRDMTLDTNYNYLSRCVNRFNKLLQSKEDKIFLTTIIDIELMKKIHENMLNLKKLLDTKTDNFLLVCMVFLYDKPYNDHYIEINNNIHIIYINCISRSNGMEFNEDKDNNYIDSIIKNNYIKGSSFGS